jgi:hypothetical protein
MISWLVVAHTKSTGYGEITQHSIQTKLTILQNLQQHIQEYCDSEDFATSENINKEELRKGVQSYLLKI